MELPLNLGGASLNGVLAENVVSKIEKKQFPKLIIKLLKNKSSFSKGMKA